MTDTTEEPSQPPWTQGPYSIKRHGLSLKNCESEPVQTPGCIQAHGALLVLHPTALTVLQVSENCAEFLGQTPQQLLGQPVASAIGAAHQAQLRALLAREALECNAVHAFTLPAAGARIALDACLHTIDAVAVLEFEPASRAPDAPPGDATGDVFTHVKSAVARLQQASGARDFCQRVTQEVRRITGLDRVMVYHFHADHHGEVYAESKRDDLAPWLGLHYPESDIPRPAREIFKRIGIRPLPDAAGPPVEMVPLANPLTGRPLNMSFCALRGASVMYTEYLANMGVAASLTMPILVDGELWGLIACHHHTPTTFPHRTRAACEFLAQVASLQLKSALAGEQLGARLKREGVHQQLVAKAALEGDLVALMDRQPSLLDAMDAHGVAMHHIDRWWCAGRTPSPVQLDALADWLNERRELDSPTRPVFVSSALARDYAAGAEMADVASGVLAVRVSRLRRDLIIWFRPETIQTISWAGHPDDKPRASGPHGERLTPRRSFELYVESVQQQAQAWSAVDVDAALRLRLLVMELVVSRAERLTQLNVDLTRSNEELDAFAYVASHDLKEPLRGIHRYAHQLLESAQSLHGEDRQRVDNLMRLTVRMDSLLDSLLHFSRVGRTTLEFEAVDLNEVLAEAQEMISARQGDGASAIECPRPLPTLRCDRVRAREIYSNLLSNALKYNLQAHPRVEVGYIAEGESRHDLHAPLEVQGYPILFVRDNGIGIEPRHHDKIFRMFKRLHGRDEFGGGVGAGLTIVEKLVHRHGGRLWLASAEGQGSTFYFTLPGVAEGTT